MVNLTERAEQWPRRRNGEPIFRTANDAIFYAQLASKRIETIDEMKAWREQAHKLLQRARERPNINLNLLMECAVRAQFFRECYEEIERIREEL